MAVAEKYPTGKKVPDSMLKTGYTLFAMKEPEKARAVLESLIEKYPDSTAAAKASERLTGR
jgi:TolA-binding protein